MGNGNCLSYDMIMFEDDWCAVDIFYCFSIHFVCLAYSYCNLNTF